MNAVFIIIMLLLGAFVIFAFCKMAQINGRIDDIYNKALTMQGDIEVNRARSQDNYKLLAKFNTEVEKVKSTIADLHKHEQIEEPAKEVEAELKSLVAEQEEEEVSDKEKELSERRNKFACLRKHGMDVKSAGIAMEVSYSTAKRYEKWRVDNKK